MIKIKFILAAFMAVFTVTSASAARDEMVAYLFTYFNSNAPEDEQICYAISDDGYNYTPLNGGAPVIESYTFA